jgi:hypothetical protein
MISRYQQSKFVFGIGGCNDGWKICPPYCPTGTLSITANKNDFCVTTEQEHNKDRMAVLRFDIGLCVDDKIKEDELGGVCSTHV